MREIIEKKKKIYFLALNDFTLFFIVLRSEEVKNNLRNIGERVTVTFTSKNVVKHSLLTY